MNWTSNFFQIDHVNCHYVDSIDEINAVVKAIEDNSNVVYVDTEFLRETTYWPILCLLQIRVGDDIFCIDTLQEDFQEILIGLCELDVTWVLHAAKQDLEIFHQLLGHVPERIFDTQIAAELCGIGEQISYGGLVEHFVNIELDKSQTRTRWDRRPLTQAQLVYAAEDVAYLPVIYDKLSTQLKSLNRETWLAEEQMKMRLEIENQADANHAYRRMRRGGNYSPLVQQGIKALSIWRESLAMSKDCPRTHVLTDDDIYTLAFKLLQKEQTIDELHRTDFKNSRLVQHHHKQIESVLNEVQSQISQSGEIGDDIWPQSIMLTKFQKQEVKDYQQTLEDFCVENHLVLSRLARKKDIVDWLYQKQSGRLSSGWRKQLIRDQYLLVG